MTYCMEERQETERDQTMTRCLALYAHYPGSPADEPDIYTHTHT